MKYRTLDLLACPMCKHFPLELIVIEEKTYEDRQLVGKPPLSELYCGFLRKKVSSTENYPCQECIKKEVEVGVLYCPNCGRWYPIEDGIIHMLPDDLRRKEDDIRFLEKYRDKLPSKIVEHGLPYNLGSQKK